MALVTVRAHDLPRRAAGLSWRSYALRLRLAGAHANENARAFASPAPARAVAVAALVSASSRRSGLMAARMAIVAAWVASIAAPARIDRRVGQCAVMAAWTRWRMPRRRAKVRADRSIRWWGRRRRTASGSTSRAVPQSRRTPRRRRSARGRGAVSHRERGSTIPARRRRIVRRRIRGARRVRRLEGGCRGVGVG